MSGERSPGPGTGGREAGPQAVSEREPGTKCSQPGLNTHMHIQKQLSPLFATLLYSVQQELNNRLTTEITRMRSCFSGETALSPLTQGKDVYELEASKCSIQKHTHTHTQSRVLFSQMTVSFLLVGVAKN